MTFAAINWLNISINLLLVVFFIVCLLMVLLILMQRPKQEGLGATFGTNVTDQVFGARTTNVLQRGTVYLGSAFFVLSLVLAILIGHRNKSDSLITREAKAAGRKNKMDNKIVMCTYRYSPDIIRTISAAYYHKAMRERGFVIF